MKKKVYIAFSTDVIYKSHLEILKKASKYGSVIVGLLTDEAIIKFKTIPHSDYEKREIFFKKIRYVSSVMPQSTLDYSNNLLKLKPDYVVHGDDWKVGFQKNIRNKVIKLLKKWDGKLIEFQYDKKYPHSKIQELNLKIGTTSEIRKGKLRRLIEAKKNDVVRILEAHNPISAIIVENTRFLKNKNFLEYDGIWSSSLTDSVSRGKPDNQSVDISTRVNGLNEILDITTKPLIVDIDNGGKIEHLSFTIKTLERMGVSAVVIEDKIGLKINSLFKNQDVSKQDSIKNFCLKIKEAKKSTISNDFMIIARIESLILEKGIKDALKRACSYSKAGADAILIHSKEKNPKEIFKFSKIFLKSNFKIPLVAVPSTYSRTYEKTLFSNGFKIVIYANHLLRASYKSMLDTSKKILQYRRGYESEKNITSINDIISLI
jgi:phosphoenolpyruvate phosphomutase